MHFVTQKILFCVHFDSRYTNCSNHSVFFFLSPTFHFRYDRELRIATWWKGNIWLKFINLSHCSSLWDWPFIQNHLKTFSVAYLNEMYCFSSEQEMTLYMVFPFCKQYFPFLVALVHRHRKYGITKSIKIWNNSHCIGHLSWKVHKSVTMFAIFQLV